MSNLRDVEVTIARVERLESSASGNPRWALIDADGKTWRTGKDSQAGYVVRALAEDVPARLTVDGRGAVRGVEYLDI